MRNSRSDRLAKAGVAMLAATLAAWSACADGPEPAVPLLIVSGPDDFISFEISTESGQPIWRVEADQPTRVPAFVYGTVPDGFHQTVPSAGAPRPLESGEDVSIESRIPDRIFLHKGYADSEATVVILEWEMRRVEPDSAKATD